MRLPWFLKRLCVHEEVEDYRGFTIYSFWNDRFSGHQYVARGRVPLNIRGYPQVVLVQHTFWKRHRKGLRIQAWRSIASMKATIDLWCDTHNLP